jgi:hypothetical protein
MAAASLLGTSWWYNSTSGSVVDEPDLIMQGSTGTGGAGIADLGLGWHGPFSTKAAALKYYTDNAAANPGWNAPAGLPAVANNAVKSVPGVSQAESAASDAWNAATAIPRFLSLITNKYFVPRLLEIVAGMILLGIGVNALFKGRPMDAVTTIAGKAAPLAMA